jgi:hypothetical protein
MSFLKALGFDRSDQKGRINSSYATANAQYDKSNDLARGDISSGLASARGYIDPIVESGRRAGTIYEGSLGLRGAAGAGEANDAFESNDALQRMRALDLKRSGQVANAGGGYNSGAAALADSRVNLQHYGDWQNRLAGLQGGGNQAAMSGANLEFGAGQAQAGREMSYGSARAGSAIGQGAALNANQNEGVNNLWKGIGAVTSLATGIPMNGLGGSSTRGSTGANGETTTPTPWWQSMWGK